MKKKFLILSAITFGILFVIPLLVNRLIGGGAALLALFALFYGINPLLFVTLGIATGLCLKRFWPFIPIATVLYILSAWLFFALGEVTFLLYGGAYFLLGAVTVGITALVSFLIKKRKNKTV